MNINEIKHPGTMKVASIIMSYTIFSLSDDLSSPTIKPGNRKPIPVPRRFMTDRTDVAMGRYYKIIYKHEKE